jgi:sterol desaturase/sphingolipid hydroxylase (fatty acid hydroxylase superfamily)
MEYLNAFIEGYKGYAGYLWQEITFGYDYKPWYQNYFYGLILLSLIFFGLEMAKPWRKEQLRFRKDFWLDIFYMFFNFFLFSLVIYNAASNVVVNFFNNGIVDLTGIDLQGSNPLHDFPYWAILLIGFLVRDFVQWWVHRLLHRVPSLWEFHKVHHSVKEMGFAAHLRYHWMETIVYRSIEYIPLALLGIGLYDFFIIHIFTLMVGHFNHSNIKIPLGPLKYIFNNPQMHIWHHAKHIPKDRSNGVNFGITLSIWDYIWKTDYIPYDGRDIELGFPDEEKFPKGFVGQATYGLKKGFLTKKINV